MTPQKGAFPAELLDEHGRLKEVPVAGEEQVTTQDDQAIGRAVRFLFRTPERVIIMALLGTCGGYMGRSFIPSSTHKTDLLAIVKDIQANVVEIKITNKAILTTLPKAQQQDALRMIQIQMAAISMAKNKGDE